MTDTYAFIYHTKAGKGRLLRSMSFIREWVKQKAYRVIWFENILPANVEEFTGIVLAGGDGSINLFVNAFPAIKVPVGLIRAGTGNDFYEHLFGKGHSLEAQLERAFGAPHFPVDAGLCNNKIFLNGLGIGFDGDVVKSGLGKQFFTGKTAYFSTVIARLFGYQETEVSIQTNHKSWSGPLFMLSAANGSTYGGGFKVAPHADMQDGLLELAWVEKISLWQRIRYLPVIEKGKHLNLPFIHYSQATKIILNSTQPLHAHLDGEWFESTRFEVQILPNQFNIRG